ncbi:MAG: type II secretion system minor pseudopilin GspJ [Thermodesulfobacteriota bacterium]
MTPEIENFLLPRHLMPGEKGPVITLPTPFNKGFTLLELLVALTIFSLVSITIFSSLTSMITTRDHLEDDSRQLAELQTAFMIIGRDIEQTIDRPVRTGYQETSAAMVWEESSATLEFSSNGRRNPAGLKRSNLQRVAYRFEDGLLYRDYWAAMDRSENSPQLSRLLIKNVEDLDITFIGDNEQIFKSWPPDTTTSGSTRQSLPRAINLQVAIKDWGKLNRLFLVGKRG